MEIGHNQQNIEDEKERKAYILNLRDFLNTHGGKRFVREMLDMCGHNLNPYSGEETPYFLGRMSIGNEFLTLIKEADPMAYPRMLMDEIKQEEANEQRIARNTNTG